MFGSMTLAWFVRHKAAMAELLFHLTTEMGHNCELRLFSLFTGDYGLLNLFTKVASLRKIK